MEVLVETEVVDDKLIFRQKAGEHRKTLEYDYHTCVGCGICVGICPTDALDLGPIPEIATGLDVPPVMIDIDKCPFCGMCAAFCPRGAFKFFFDDVNILDMEEYPHVYSEISVNDNCLPCKLCEKVCPNESIQLDLHITKKEDIKPFEAGKKGSISVDMEKCNFCGLCADFCEAFILVEKEATQENPSPYSDLVIDEKSCDYCGLCEDLCPGGAIEVEGDKIEAPIDLSGQINIDDETCIRCGWCKLVCPYDAIEITKPFEGDIWVTDETKCDPHGCRACIDICPDKAWYIPSDPDEKIAVSSELCTFCGACANACTPKIIEIRRDKINHTEIKHSSWSKEWGDAISKIRNRVQQQS